MSKMRTILKTLMESNGHTSYDIYRKTGVQPSTITRYMKGGSNSLMPETVSRIARLYGITESQMRGDAPIDGQESPVDQLKDVLPLEEYRFVSNVKQLSEESRGILYRLAEMLAAEAQAEYRSDPEDRRRESVYPNQQLRIGENRHQAPPTKRRRKLPTDGNYNAPSKPYQSA